MRNLLLLILTSLIVAATYAQIPQMMATTPDALFKYTAGNSAISRLYKFNSSATGPQNSTLAEGPNGKLYGLAQGGGQTGAGMWGFIFEYDPDTNIFDTVARLRPDDGMYPQGALTLASNGKFYGVAPRSNQSNYIGTLFSYQIGDDTVVKLKDFPQLLDGPQGPVIQAHNGKIYGTCGPYLYSYDIGSDSLKMLYNTNFSLNNSLIEVGQDTLYGFSFNGGSGGGSTVYRFIPTADSGTFTVLRTLPSPCSTYSTPLLATDGKLYGMTNAGINTSTGNGIFSYNISTNTYTYLYDLGSAVYMDGTYPFNDLYQASDGMLYGMTHGGGTLYGGVIFKYDPISSQYTRLVNMDSSGSRPMYGHFMERTPHATVFRSPVSPTACAGSTVILTASAYGQSVTQQWQVSMNGGTTFTDIQGATDSIYSFMAVGSADGYQYRSLYHSRMVVDTSAVAILHVLHAGRDTISQNSCTGSAYTLHGHTYTSSGAYSDTIRAGATSGCDSITTLFLTIDPSVRDTTFATICVGSSFAVGAHSYSSSGIYTDTITGGSTHGCDSIVTLYLAVLNNTTAYFSIQPAAIPQLWYALNQCAGPSLSYVWNWGDGTPTSTGATPTHIYDTAGYYDVCVTVTDSLGCSATFCDTAVYMTKTAGGTVELDVVMQIPTGIADINNDELQISYYRGAFHFSSALAAPTRISLYDMSGRKVMEQNGISGSVWQTSAAIASGAYLLHIENSSHSLSRKILILQ